MTDVISNPQTGVIDNPLYPCYKAEGFCRLRVHPPEEGLKFECVQDPKYCWYLKKAVKEEPPPVVPKQGKMV